MQKRAGMHRMEAFLAEPVQIEDGPQATRLAPFSRDIVFDEVSFAYDGTPVLDRVSFRIPRGSSVAIVGFPFKNRVELWHSFCWHLPHQAG